MNRDFKLPEQRITMRAMYKLLLLALSLSRPLVGVADSIGEIIWTEAFLNPEDRVPTVKGFNKLTTNHLTIQLFTP
ncbi:MAG: hypothetical protein AAF804_15280 [Bacteroidota bacterium]